MKWWAKENGSPSMPGELGRVAGGAEQPDLRHVAVARHRLHVAVGVALGELALEEADQLGELAREVLVGERRGRAPQGGGGDLVGPRGAPDPEVDPARVKRLQHPELLGDHQRRVVGQHHAAGADPHPLGPRRQGRRQDRRRGARDPGDVVVLGDPVAVIAEPLGRLARGRPSWSAPRRGWSPRRRSRGRGPRAWGPVSLTRRVCQSRLCDRAFACGQLAPARPSRARPCAAAGSPG